MLGCKGEEVAFRRIEKTSLRNQTCGNCGKFSKQKEFQIRSAGSALTNPQLTSILLIAASEEETIPNDMANHTGMRARLAKSARACSASVLNNGKTDGR